MLRKSVKGLARTSVFAVLAVAAVGMQSASAADSPFVGQLMYAGFNFAPLGWAFCDGQLMPISQNTALFSLLGTNFGGDGRSTFALPDMQGRFPIHQGQGPGLSDYFVGESGGSGTVTVLGANLPPHSHSLSITTGHITASSGAASSAVPAAHALANTGRNPGYNAVTPDVTLGAPTAISGFTAGAGSSAPVGIMPPFLTVSCAIALQGVFPARN